MICGERVKANREGEVREFGTQELRKGIVKSSVPEFVSSKLNDYRRGTLRAARRARLHHDLSLRSAGPYCDFFSASGGASFFSSDFFSSVFFSTKSSCRSLSTESRLHLDIT